MCTVQLVSQTILCKGTDYYFDNYYFAAHLIKEGFVCWVLDFSLASVVSHCTSDNWTYVRTRELPTFYDSYTNLKQFHIYIVQLYKAQWFCIGWCKPYRLHEICIDVFKVCIVCTHISVALSVITQCML